MIFFFQFHNGLCVLTQNIINEKIYLILWFWYIFLGKHPGPWNCLSTTKKESQSNYFVPGPVSVIYLCYRLITLMFHGVRYSLLYRKVKRKYDDEMPRALDYILAKGQLGDWFVLYQLSKNCNPYFFREFIKELSRDLRAKPKKSRSEASSSKIQPHAVQSLIDIKRLFSSGWRKSEIPEKFWSVFFKKPILCNVNNTL